MQTELLNELRRVSARLAELDAKPRQGRDLARDAAEKAVAQLQQERSASRGLVTSDLHFVRVEKLLSNGKRILRGIASQPKVDLVGDIVEPLGGSWSLPCPCLWQHRHDSPIGWVREAVASREGIAVVIEIATGVSKADSAWQMIELGLCDSLSIGFRGLESEPIATGRRFTRWSLMEISIVTIPALPSAKIVSVGKADSVSLADRNAGAVRLLRTDAQRYGVKLKVSKPGVKLMRQPGESIPLIAAKPVAPQKSAPLPGGAVALLARGK